MSQSTNHTTLSEHRTTAESARAKNRQAFDLIDFIDKILDDRYPHDPVGFVDAVLTDLAYIPHFPDGVSPLTLSEHRTTAESARAKKQKSEQAKEKQ